MKIGVLGHLLLGLLHEGERTGWELTREFDTSLANVWAASHSQIYPELAKLAGGGFIRKTAAGPRGSQRYALSDAGRSELKTWLADTDPAYTPRSEWMARVFFLGMLPREAAVAYLARQGAGHRGRLKTYQALAAKVTIENPSTRWDRIAVEAGVRHETAMSDWTAWAIEALGEVSPD